MNDRLRAFLSGIDPDGGGYDTWGNPIQGLIPGGGALAGATQIGGGIMDLIGSKNEIKRQRKLKGEAQKRAAAARGKLDDFSFDISQAQRDLATAGIRPTDLSPMQAIQATELSALASDPRALMGGLGASTMRAQAATQAAQQADLQRELGAMQGLADLEQSALEKKQDLQLGLQQQDYEMGLMDRAMAQQNIEAAKQAKRDAISNIIGGGLSLATAGIASGKDKAMGGRIHYENGGVHGEKVKKHLIGGLLGSAAARGAGFLLQKAAGSAAERFGSKVGDQLGGAIMDKFGVGDRSNRVGAEGDEITITVSKNGETKTMNSGGVIEEILRRQPVQKTEGEFNHDTNKKAIIDEETGVKEGEATGGEYILNPEQGEEIHMAYKGLERIVESGEEPTMDQLMALYEAVQSVFSQPQFNEA